MLVYVDTILSIIASVPAIIGAMTFLAQKFKNYLNLHDEAKKNAIYYYIFFIINLLIATSLPISLMVEFGFNSGEATHYKTFDFYAKHYPHLVIYPSFFFGFAGLFILQSALIRWEISQKSVLIGVAIAIVGAFIAMYYESTGKYSMVFEFNKKAQQTINPISKQQPCKLGISKEFIERMAPPTKDSQEVPKDTMAPQAMQTIKEENCGCNPRIDINDDWKSYSRVFYLATFWYTIFIMLLGFSLLLTGPIPSKMSQRLDYLLSLNLAGALIVFLMWIPFRIYYNVQTKIPLFGEKELIDNFLGISLDFNFVGLMASDITPIAAIIIAIYFLLLRVAKKYTIFIAAATSILIIVVLAALAYKKPDIFSEIYGPDGDIKYLVFRFVVLLFILLVTYNILLPRVDKNPSKDEQGEE